MQAGSQRSGNPARAAATKLTSLSRPPDLRRLAATLIRPTAWVTQYTTTLYLISTCSPRGVHIAIVKHYPSVKGNTSRQQRKALER
ncbi:hypothetical protein RMSM_05825 [Rhodopirellula maiorica SM1]|uniref:Uncharacterized protein n=1 Tax=Rhodopirellula maiorica SM1 TaxID=1265738 RepID=M5RCP3_9BACT|nr:hypothetical protein RMSM_05825 [Rhodopirellula maiorica SM1]